MNNVQIFEHEEFGKVRNIENKNRGKYTGFFYVLEWDNLVKIGSTKNPYQRVMALRRNAEKYGKSKIGRVAFSKPHTNYKENEKKLHEKFSDCRKNDSELFNISFDEVMNNELGDIEYLDESEKIDKRAESFANGMKNFILGGFGFGRN